MSAVLPSDVLWATGDPRRFDGPWLPAEAAVVARSVEKRRREFGCGRHLARSLLSRLGFEVAALPPSSDRRVPWPLEVVGSVSHCEDLCLVAVARRQDWTSVGVDIEPDTPLAADTLPIVTTASEQARFQPSLPAQVWGKAAFVAKEAYYKAQFELTRRFLEFEDVEVHFERPPARAQIVSFQCSSSRAPSLTGRLLRSDGHVWAFSGLPQS
ncbi:MAG: 4'-phosphopantetheinyl transferase superfamily protein [Myxococcota bacterium]